MPQRITPTRSNLLRVRQALKMAQEGYEILDKKRQVLTSELIRVAHDATAQQTEVWQKFDAAYQTLTAARLSMGRERLMWTALAVHKSVEVEIKLQSVMGVVIPRVEVHGAPPEMPYGLGSTTVALDEVTTHFRDVLTEIPRLSETLTTVWRLAHELQKTQRRVNALHYIFIPEYEEAIAYIENALEEREREETFRLKRLKARRETVPTPNSSQVNEWKDAYDHSDRQTNAYMGT